MTQYCKVKINNLYTSLSWKCFRTSGVAPVKMNRFCLSLKFISGSQLKDVSKIDMKIFTQIPRVDHEWSHLLGRILQINYLSFCDNKVICTRHVISSGHLPAVGFTDVLGQFDMKTRKK